MLKNCFISVTLDLVSAILNPISVVMFLVFFFKSGKEFDIASSTVLLRITYILEDAFHWIPACITCYADLRIGVRRMTKFLRSEELNLDNFQTPDVASEFAIEIQDGTFYWDEKVASDSEDDDGEEDDDHKIDKIKPSNTEVKPKKVKSVEE